MLSGQCLGHMFCSQPLDTGMAIHYMGSKSAEWSRDVSCYHGSLTVHQFLSQVFLSYLQGDLRHWAHRIKDMDALDDE